MQNAKKLTAALLAALMLLAACGGTQPPASQPAGGGGGDTVSYRSTFTVAIDAEPAKLDPHTQNLSQAYQVQEHIFDNLLKKDPDGNFQPSLALEWDIVDDTTIVFKLRQDAYFHNGQQVTANDVVYSIDRATKGSNSSSLFRDFDAENTKALDDFTVEVKLHQPSAVALVYLSTPRGHILCADAVEEMGDEYFLKPIGSGPFKFVKWVSGDRIELVRNDEYWGETSSYENLIFRAIPDSSVRAIELETGGIDFMFTVGPEDYDRLKGDPNVVTHDGPGFTHEILQMNMQDEELKDIRLREAFNIALDVNAIVRAVYGDLGTPASSIFSSEIFAHKAVGPIKQDVARAKQLVIDAGYPNGFSIDIEIAENRETMNMLEIAQAMWAEVGLNVNIITYDQATIRERYANGMTRFARGRFVAATGDPDHAMAAWAYGYAGAFQPTDRYIDDMMAKGRGEYDAEARKAIYAELQQYCWDTYYAVPLVIASVTYAHRDYVQGFDFNPSGIPNLVQLDLIA